MTETTSWKYPQRTRRNIEDTDATLILARGPLTGGTALTARLAREIGRPSLSVDLDRDDAAVQIGRWLRLIAPGSLNIAGPRQSTSPGVDAATRDVLLEAFSAGAAVC